MIPDLVPPHHLRHHRRPAVDQMAVLAPHAADRVDAVRDVLRGDCDVDAQLTETKQ